MQGWSRPVSDEALRIWARRKCVDPEAAVAWPHDRFPRGERRQSPPPRMVAADPEAFARGTYKTPLQRRLEGEDV